eukprot:CAMPEP_0175381482 /NCGR_PEP_ID=MMETSP0095-20121207/26843_2 /TAXON_ID=311494 /ORGANISM="Alexandrium monilatum, Strain CCMP3105" /LENGTH=185 /DNA_ID=CAMNT_0016679857 /DNA_START=465 /DNA_END=1018 /DNA_ORIENTATION=-
MALALDAEAAAAAQTSRDGLKAIGGGVLRGALTRSRELRADMPLASLRRQSHHVQQHHHQHDRVYYGGDDGHEVEGPSGLRGALRDGHIAHRGQDGCGQQVHHRVAYMPMVSYVHDEVQQEEDYQPDDRTSQPLHRLLLLRISNLEAQDGMAVRHEGLVITISQIPHGPGRRAGPAPRDLGKPRG